MGKSNRKSRRKTLKVPHKSGGFDFGFIQRAIYANTSSLDFNNHMIAAKVIGCAYGYDAVQGYPDLVPCLTIIGEKEDELLEASKCFEQWGCTEDGDAVDLTILLQRDGGYLLGVQPSYERMTNRVVRDSALVNLLFTGVTWIKTIDSANPILLDWKKYLTSRFSPVKILFATAKTRRGIPQTDTLRKVEGAISLVKFDLRIITEDEEPNHWFFDIVRKRGKSRMGSQGTVKETPRDIAASRRRVIDSAFPISRERVRRAGLPDKVRTLTADEVTDDQILQAAINVLVSRDIGNGALHFEGVDKVEDSWWDHVRRRVEVAGDGEDFANIEAAVVARQLELDVEHTLRRHGAAVSSKFVANQKLFSRLGYADA